MRQRYARRRSVSVPIPAASSSGQGDDFGHLEIEVTVDDPKAYTKPWSVTLRQQFAADTELIDEICAEGEKFSEKLK